MGACSEFREAVGAGADGQDSIWVDYDLHEDVLRAAPITTGIIRVGCEVVCDSDSRGRRAEELFFAAGTDIVADILS